MWYAPIVLLYPQYIATGYKSSGKKNIGSRWNNSHTRHLAHRRGGVCPPVPWQEHAPDASGFRFCVKTLQSVVTNYLKLLNTATVTAVLVVCRCNNHWRASVVSNRSRHDVRVTCVTITRTLQHVHVYMRLYIHGIFVVNQVLFQPYQYQNFSRHVLFNQYSPLSEDKLNEKPIQNSCN